MGHHTTSIAVTATTRGVFLMTSLYDINPYMVPASACSFGRDTRDGMCGSGYDASIAHPAA